MASLKHYLKLKEDSHSLFSFIISYKTTHLNIKQKRKKQKKNVEITNLQIKKDILIT